MRGLDTHFHFYDPWLWTIPGISLFLQSLGPHSPLGPWFICIQAAHASFLQISVPFMGSTTGRPSWPHCTPRQGCTGFQAGGCPSLPRYQLRPRGSAGASHWQSHSDGSISISRL